MSAVIRERGYLPIRDYAAIGDGRTAALVGRDGAIDWLCLPDLDSPSVFAAVLDDTRGGRFALAPSVPFEARRRYLPDTNVLETTFVTSAGRARVTDAMTLPLAGLSPYRELVRRVDGLSGRVPLRWTVEPRFAYGARTPRFASRAGVPVAADGRDAIALTAWDVGDPVSTAAGLGGEFVTDAGSVGVLALAAAHQEPLVFPARADALARLEATARSWRDWASSRTYAGPWRDAVVRSALALKLLVFAPSGAIAAAVTTSLPEEMGGTRNWDYRFSWPRDAAFTLQALLALGCGGEAEAFFSWLLHASQLTHPRLQVLYRLDGRSQARERALPLAGYRCSTPVRVGNAAATQLQLDVYGEVLLAASRYADAAPQRDADHGARLADTADLVAAIWHDADAGIWEVRSNPAQFTQSKMMCAVALDCAVALAENGHVRDNGVARWRREATRIRHFVETQCYSPRLGSYTRAAGDESVDAALLLGTLSGYDSADAPRLRGTVDAIRRELASGALVHRYVGDDGLPGDDGAFVACSFWLAEALARQGQVDEAAAVMDELVEMANDVGLYAEEIDAETGAFLGNFPQGLSHLALINAAVAIAAASS
jgi:GH15 family glucan-1,4-alpha-glucosidase